MFTVLEIILYAWFFNGIKNIVFDTNEKYLTNIFSSGYNSMNMPK